MIEHPGQKGTNEIHRRNVSQLSSCRNKTELRRKESELGCRYSSLLELPYFDPPAMLVIDPMHNLFLGVAKHFCKKIMIGMNILKDEDFSVLQNCMDKILCPANIGRIPHKICSSFRIFTANQYKNWVVHYSLLCLHGLLNTEHMECWQHFVLACRILCQPSLTKRDIVVADGLLLQFCHRTEQLFKKDIIIPNMHMCCHLRECILDYGPLNNFWVFAFESFNGILGQLPNNNKSIEVQMLNWFLSDTTVLSINFPDKYIADFTHLIRSDCPNVGTLGADISIVNTEDKLLFSH